MEWINVNDKLPTGGPKESVRCVVYDKNRGIVIRPFNIYHQCWDDEDGDDFYTDAINGNITHWMSLPDLPN